MLPRIQWLNDEPRITAPAMQPEAQRYIDHYTQNPSSGWEGVHYWGTVGSWNAIKRIVSKARVEAILLEFESAPESITYSESLHGRGSPQSSAVQTLFYDVDQWFDRVRTWLGAALDQDIDPLNPISYITVPGNGLQILTVEESLASLPARASAVHIVREDYGAATLPLLRKVVKHANTGAIPNDAHLLLRDGKADLRRGRYRRAVIDAGSAVEITLADFNSRVVRVNTGTRPPTLGWYVDQPRIATQAGVPANNKIDLVEIRNKAIHENRAPGRDEAIRALGLAKAIVDGLDPLPL